MKTEQEMKEIVRKMLEQYLNVSSEHGSFPWRVLGGLEMALVLVGALELGKPFNRKEIEEPRFDFIFFKVGKVKRMENVQEVIVRVATEWLEKQENK